MYNKKRNKNITAMANNNNNNKKIKYNDKTHCC